MQLENGSRVGVVGGGPAGSLFAYFVLTFARRADLHLEVDVFEPRDFTAPGPAGCNMCGGLVSETLVQALAIEGIDLPPTVVQRGIDSYVLHTADGALSIQTPLREKRIATLHRGGGPRDAESRRHGGLDGYLLGLSKSLGANVVRARVDDVGWKQGRPEVRLPVEMRRYDLLVGATGVNSGAWPLFEKLGLSSRPPRTAKTFITELRLGRDAVSRYFGDAVHLFLLDIPKLDCAAIVPKSECVTVCLLGAGIDSHTISAFFRCEAVRRCLPPGAAPDAGGCRCSPRINEREASRPFADRVVLVGDCGVSRLYKDGIGSAYRTAKCAARAAVFSGIAAADFKRHYWPLYRSIARDNRYGELMFLTMHLFKAFPGLLRGAVRMAAREQQRHDAVAPMSLVFWDMFTGSAPYRENFYRTVRPRFVGGLAAHVMGAAFGRGTRRTAGAPSPAASGTAVAVGGGMRTAEAGERRRVEREDVEMSEGMLGREYGDGEVLCRQGDSGDRMFVLQSGHAEVFREEGGRETQVGELGPGDVFGQMAVVDREPRSATVRVRGRARVLTLDRRAFLRRAHEDPSFAYKVLESMSRLVRRLDKDLSLLRNAGRANGVRYVYVVTRERSRVFEQLSREFENDPDVEVVRDRRFGERRHSDSEGAADRRQAERRSPQDSWSGRLSRAFPREGGRATATAAGAEKQRRAEATAHGQPDRN